MMNPTPISPKAAVQLNAVGALLVDVRDPSEHARERIPGAHNVPLASLGDLPAGSAGYVFHCRSGARTAAHAAALAAAAGEADSYVIAGGIDAWRAAGLALDKDPAAPLEIMRQVQIAAGALILISVLLAVFVAPPFIALAAFVGAGLTFAGATGWCGMAKLLQRLPWNRPATSA